MTGIIVDFIQRFINQLSSDLPRFEIGSGDMANIRDAVRAIVTFLTDVNFILPLGDIAAIVMICLTVSIAKVAIFVVNWVVRRVCDLIP